MSTHDPYRVGVTGGIGAGKSTVCRIFSILKISVYNSDQRARWLMENDMELISEIKDFFGNQSYDSGKVDREFLAKEVFSDEVKLSKLNELVHPVVNEDFQNWVTQHLDSSYIIKEAALLFETGSYRNLDFVVNVYAPRPMRIKRILKRDGFRTEEEIQLIIEKQFGDEVRIQLADFQIVNDDLELVIPQVLKLHDRFVKSS